MQDLLLTAGERKIFDALSDSLKEGWTVRSEKIETFESPEELYMRYKIAHFTDLVCVTLAKRAEGISSMAEFEKIASTFDVSSLPHEQLAELFFVLGTRVISAMIQCLLSRATTDEDLEGIAVLTNIRRMLKEANVLP